MWGHGSSFWCFWGPKLAAKKLIYCQNKSETHSEKGDWTYRDCTTESKHLSAVGLFERGLLLVKEALQRKFLCMNLASGFQPSVFGLLAEKLTVEKKESRRYH